MRSYMPMEVESVFITTIVNKYGICGGMCVPTAQRDELKKKTWGEEVMNFHKHADAHVAFLNWSVVVV